MLTALATALLTLVTVAAPAHAATVDADAWYLLVNRRTGQVMDVRDGSTADGGVVQQWGRNDGAWQQWRFVDAGDGWYQLENRQSRKMLDVWRKGTADGTSIKQYRDTDGRNQQFRLVDAGAGRVRLVARHSGKAVTVKDGSTASGAPLVQTTDDNRSAQQWELVRVGTPSDVVGWAAQGGGTTGGGNAAITTVTSASALAAAVAGTGAGVVRVQGTISCSGMIQVGSNKTVEGASGSSITGCGLTIRHGTNVIVRNLSFDRWADDAVNVEGSTRVVVDHNTFGSGYDGAVDIKTGSDLVTVSWNRFRGQDKNSLVGHSDDNGAQDRGKLRVTYHHNWFDGTNQRNPRVRFGNPVHVYNNLYTGVTSYGVASTQEAGVLVEANWFEDVRDPFHLGEGKSPAGSLVARGNHHVRSGTGSQGGSVAPVPYAYTLDPVLTVKEIVQAGAGQR